MSLYKIYDPGSVVSMNESGQVIGTDSAVGKFQAFANSMMTGQKLRPEIRDQVIDAARSRFREVYNDYDRRVTQNNDLAKRYDLQPDRVVIDVREPELQQQMDALNQRDRISKSISVDQISNASLDDLNLLNKRVLNANQMSAVKRRLEELGQPPAPPAPTGTGTSVMGPPMPPPMIKPLGGSLSTLGNKQLLPLGFGQ
jgi:hypothetical protein